MVGALATCIGGSNNKSSTEPHLEEQQVKAIQAPPTDPGPFYGPNQPNIPPAIANKPDNTMPTSQEHPQVTPEEILDEVVKRTEKQPTESNPESQNQVPEPQSTGNHNDPEESNKPIKQFSPIPGF